MKYIKCEADCSKRATKKFRGIKLCEDHYKESRRAKGANGIWICRLVATLSPGCRIYQHGTKKFK